MEKLERRVVNLEIENGELRERLSLYENPKNSQNSSIPPISYGNNIEGPIGYFHARQYVPFARMKEMMSDVFNIQISQGGLHYLLNRFADKTAPFYQTIRKRV